MWANLVKWIGDKYNEIVPPNITFGARNPPNEPGEIPYGHVDDMRARFAGKQPETPEPRAASKTRGRFPTPVIPLIEVIKQREGEEGYAEGCRLNGEERNEFLEKFAAKLESVSKDVAKRFEENACPQGKLDDYRIEGLLSRGGYGSIYLVTHVDEGSTWVLKIQSKKQFENPDPDRREDRRQQTLNEKKLLFALKNDFIVELRSTFQDSANLYFIMDYGIYGDLRKIQKKTSEKTVKQIAAQIYFAIMHIHQSGFVHRDLKPANVFIYEDGYVKLGDFGLARRLDIHGKVYGFHGQGDYMAPEMYSNGGYGKYIDWWAFGATLFEMLYNRTPFGKPLGWKPNKGVYSVKLKFPGSATEKAKDLFTALFHGDLTMRLGNTGKGGLEVARHKWFEGVEFGELFNKNIRFDVELPRTEPDTSPENKFTPPKGDPKANPFAGF